MFVPRQATSLFFKQIVPNFAVLWPKSKPRDMTRVKFVCTVLLLGFWMCGITQTGNPIQADTGIGIRAEVLTFTGRVLDRENNEAISFATVSLLSRVDGGLLGGTTSDIDGYFEVQSSGESSYIEIEFLGYEKLIVSDYEVQDGAVFLGNVFMSESTQLLEEVVVTTERSTTEFKADKRVFNVGSDLTSSGASALEVLNNVPSVNVDIEGAVTLRGSSGVQILINGKPSVLADEESGALGNITAEMIQKVEVITNPSAKYEAEGTSGIINIVLNKNDKEALNGSISLNVGTPQNHSVGVSLNKRTDKFNLFTQLGVGLRDRISDTETRNINLNNDFELNSFGFEARNEGYYNIVLGTDYYISPKDVITLSGSYTQEFEDQPSETLFTLRNAGGLSNWQRTEETTASNPKFQFELQYNKEFQDNKEHKLSFSAIGNSFTKDQSSVFEEWLVDGTRDITNQLTATDFGETKFTFNLDYTKPLTKQFTLETGIQYVDNDVSNDYQVEDFFDGAFVINPGLTNLFEYRQNVLGAYTTAGYEGDVWGFKLGLRAENTDLTTLLTNTNESNNQNFLDWFPTAHSSYKLNDHISFQAGYSRRIYRPRLWDLNPFFNIRNNFSIRTGNPLLTPEYTDSYEIGSVFIFDKLSYNINVYRRFTTDKIERITRFSENVATSTPLNIGTAATNGVELNFKLTSFKNFTLSGDVNYNLFTREGSFENQTFDFSNDQTNVKLTSKIKFSKAFEMEATGRFESDVQTVQGIRSGNQYLDLGMRYKIMKGKIVLNLSLRDVFATRIRESFTFQETFENYRFSQLGRFITFGASYGFGKGEAITYGGGGRRR